ncbi:enoyl-CoA hydratase/isomerase family protein [Sphingosinicella microcystinivorans]|uniref:enoyl-CoA hydratase/isomerase family protein n=1 Tax=Sphingosinicella microcystinivorans TaxID=335406 RepID=UPI0022F3B358|nr:enoyl-CoA hydratase/isomerase family protein [Sphingosinicella microcystinivorans]WBX83777.1 enoyl-CoA hydratase/isomerase family protein [Sphingosinicella microcystinivorans]
MSQTSFVPHYTLAEYGQRLAEHFIMERSEGVLEVRFHTNGAEVLWSMELHRALSQMFQAVGQDPENEVLILSGTGDLWINKRDMESYHAHSAVSYDIWYRDSTKLVENLLWAVDIPTIAAINGPGFHTEFGLLCDLTIAAEDAIFFEPHFSVGVAPGDGQFLVYQTLMGLKRANHVMYLQDQGITAAEALQWGLVGEVHPREKLMPRAREIAAQLMRQPRTVRRLTTQIARRPLRRAIQNDFGMHLAHELFGVHESPRSLSHFEKK